MAVCEACWQVGAHPSPQATMLVSLRMSTAMTTSRSRHREGSARMMSCAPCSRQDWTGRHKSPSSGSRAAELSSMMPSHSYHPRMAASRSISSRRPRLWQNVGLGPAAAPDGPASGYVGAGPRRSCAATAQRSTISPAARTSVSPRRGPHAPARSVRKAPF